MDMEFRPTRELPAELQKMDKSETACRYCGVSYLIHHEFKSMERRLAELQGELAELVKCKINEERLRERLTTTEAQLQTSNARLRGKEDELKEEKKR